MNNGRTIKLWLLAGGAILFVLFLAWCLINVEIRFTSHTELGGPESPVYYSIVRGEPLRKIEAHLRDDPSDVMDFYFNRLSLLGHAVSSNRSDVIELLIEYGADPDGTGMPNEFTPLMTAIIYEDLTAVELLLRHGADPEKVSPGMGRSPIAQAQADGLQSFVWLMREWQSNEVDGDDSRSGPKVELGDEEIRIWEGVDIGD